MTKVALLLLYIGSLTIHYKTVGSKWSNNVFLASTCKLLDGQTTALNWNLEITRLSNLYECCHILWVYKYIF